MVDQFSRSALKIHVVNFIALTFSEFELKTDEYWGQVSITYSFLNFN